MQKVDENAVALLHQVIRFEGGFKIFRKITLLVISILQPHRNSGGNDF
jgi:hypothetical protein